MPSPIEMMVDAACGYKELEKGRPKKRTTKLDYYAQLLLAVADAAEEFYKDRVDIPRHSLSSSDRKLIDAVKAWLEVGGGKGSE